MSGEPSWELPEAQEEQLGPGERLDFSFTGQASTPLSVDPAEFVGLAAGDIATQLMKMAQEANPHLAYFSDEIELAADLIVETNAGR